MPAQVVWVHDEPDFTTNTVTALRYLVGDENVVLFTNSMSALNAFEVAEMIDVLITRTEFPEGQPKGISPRLMGRTKRPNVKIVLLATVDTLTFTEGIGEVLVAPVTAEGVGAKVREMLG
jgi:hypothetical protein